MKNCEACPLVTLCKSDLQETQAESGEQSTALGLFAAEVKTFVREQEDQPGSETVIIRTQEIYDRVLARSGDRLGLEVVIQQNYRQLMGTLMEQCPGGPVPGTPPECSSSAAADVKAGLQRTRLLRRAI